MEKAAKKSASVYREDAGQILDKLNGNTVSQKTTISSDQKEEQDKKTIIKKEELYSLFE